MKKQPTSATDLRRINAMFDRLTDLIVNLACRWQDEAGYEKIDDYGKVISKKLPRGFRLVRMHTRPFGFDFVIGTAAVYRVAYTTSNAYAWKRVA